MQHVEKNTDFHGLWLHVMSHKSDLLLIDIFYCHFSINKKSPADICGILPAHIFSFCISCSVNNVLLCDTLDFDRFRPVACVTHMDEHCCMQDDCCFSFVHVNSKIIFLYSIMGPVELSSCLITFLVC